VILTQVHADGAVESWDSDAGTYTLTRADQQLAVRALTWDELRWLAGGHPVSDPVDADTWRGQARDALRSNRAFLDLPEPSYPLNTAAQRALVGQVVDLTRQVNAIIRLLVGRDTLTDTSTAAVVPWACATGTPTTADGATFRFDLSGSFLSPHGGYAIRVERRVLHVSGTGTYTVTLQVVDGATTYSLPWVLPVWQVGTEADFAMGLDDWLFNLTALPLGVVLDDVRVTVTFTGSLAVTWRSVCVIAPTGG
jgi:hypothetical protein